MTFLNPFALIGLVAAGIPVLLHLLNLRKVKVIEFSTLSFLKELQPTTLRRLHIRQLLLLVLRTLLIILLVLAFSRPTLKGTATGGLGSRVKTTAVIAIDDSPSMERHDQNGSLWKQATSAASGVLGLLEDGDEIVLVGFSHAASLASSPEERIYRTIARARSALGELRTGNVTVPIGDVLRAAFLVFQGSPNAQKELYLLSDFQEGLFSPQPSEQEPPPPVSDGALQTYALHIGEGTPRNLGLTEVRVVNSIVEQGKPFTLAVTLANSSTEEIKNAVISVFLNENRVTAKAVDVAAGTSPTVDIPVVAGGPGFVNGTVSVDDDDFRFDNSRYFSLNLRKELRVVLIGSSSSLRYARTAIGTRSSSGPTVRIEESDPERVSESLLQNADVLLVANTASFSASAIASIRSWLQAGGGMIFFPGPLTDERSYASLADALGLPQFRALQQVPRQTNDGEPSPVVFDQVDRKHPIFQQMFQPRIGDASAGGSTGVLESPEIWTHAVYGPSIKSQTIVTLSDGSPFLMDHAVGAGRVLLYTVEAEAGWSDLPFKGLFVPLLLRSVSYVAGEQAIMPQIISGATGSVLERVKTHGPLVVHTPRGNTIAVPTLSSKADALSADELTQPGVYDVTEGSATVSRFVVNGAPSESLLRSSSHEELEREASRNGFDPAAVRWIEDRASLARVITEARLGAELWHIALAAALVVALLELLLARTAGRATEEPPTRKTSVITAG